MSEVFCDIQIQMCDKYLSFFSLGMSLFQFICADYFGDELPLPLPAVKMMKQDKNEKEKEKKMDSTYTAAAAAKIIKDDSSSRNRALTFTPAFDGLFQFEITEQKKKKKNSTDTAAAKTLNFGAAIDNVAVGESKKNSSKNKALAYAPAFDGLFPFEMFVSR
ncbi:hypothetical protein HAX54_035725 [Datura stramonium]|uniref:Uncharacterized protein n=1 Tax=Datura stramonium TaxID=4076 RepID=A0ABS8VH14_DATST|nr:hypothetical protein [Datura stramonium]